MSSTSVQELTELAESIGLKGVEIMNFVREQQTLEREEREREDKRMDKLKLFEIEEKAKMNERLERERLFELEQHTKVVEREEKDGERRKQMKLLEVERIKLELEREERARQQKERERQFEIDRQEREMHLEQEKHKQEMEKLDFQAKIRELEARVAEGRGRQSDGNGREVPVGKAENKVPKMPYFDEERDFMDSYLGRFERFAEIQKWKREHWAVYLSALLKGRALDVYSRMPPEQTGDYDRLKDALLKRYTLSADGFKKRFRTAEPEAGETPSQFLTRIDNYLERWIELAEVTKSYEGLKTLIVQEQYLNTCPKEMAMHLKEGKSTTLTELGDVAEKYIDAHATDIVFGVNPRSPKFRSAPSTKASSPARRCYLCGKVGHVQSQCSRRNPDNSLASPPKIQRAPYAQQRTGYSSPRVPRTPPRIQRSSQLRYPTRGQVPRCFLCNRPGHLARNCLSRPTACRGASDRGKSF